jgi:hypothetical protein
MSGGTTTHLPCVVLGTGMTEVPGAGGRGPGAGGRGPGAGGRGPGAGGRGPAAEVTCAFVMLSFYLLLKIP